MYDISCELLSITISQDNVGNEVEILSRKTIPIIKVESIYADEYYKASQSGFKPALRLKISALNYNNESKLKYMDNEYDIIRVEEQVDEIILICERRIKNESE